MRVAVVNDSQMSQEVLRRALLASPGCELAWIAKDGKEALAKCGEDKPDLLLMDLIMPVMDGVEATRRIMAASPCQILIVTASVDGNSSRVFEALGAGAIDAVKTPAIGLDGKLAGNDEFLRKLSSIQKLSATSKPAELKPKPKPKPKEPALLPHVSDDAKKPLLVAIGSSTGGPTALLDLLSSIPADVNAAFVVIQHLDKQFAKGLASWLDSLCDLEVLTAKEGDAPQRGKVLLAETNDHMVLTHDRRLRYTPVPEDNPFRPSADVFFSSLAANAEAKGAAVLLTGIGRDGANGLLALKKSGWMTFAQDKDSCVVYGMPKAAAELDAACETLPPKEIARRILKLLSLHQREAL